MLNERTIHQILERLPSCSIAVVGDFFLDHYLDIDGRLTEPSVETGLDAYQVVGIRSSPGAGGTVTNNLSALGVGRIVALSVIGIDGSGFELRRALEQRHVDSTHIIEAIDRFTPTYAKPMLSDRSVVARELNRIDIKNRRPMPEPIVAEILQRLEQVVTDCDAVIVADQVSEPDCGVITRAVRDRLGELGASRSGKILFADSRERIGQFRNVITKPNRVECIKAVGLPESDRTSESALDSAVRQLSRATDRPVYCTLGDRGILYVDAERSQHIPTYPVTGPVDIVGAGDSTTAGIVGALCAGADPLDAAAFGNLIASITIQQIGTTGTATPQQILDRWREVGGK